VFTGLVVSDPVPNRGQVGTLVTVFGTNFDTTRGRTQLFFRNTFTTTDSTQASIVSVAFTGINTVSTSIVALVPNVQPGFYRMRVKNLTTGLNGISSGSYQVFTLSPPSISSVNPTTGTPGTTVTITGTNFFPQIGGNQVFFNGLAGLMLSESATQLVVAVPAGATSGNVTVVVNNLTAIGPSFTYIPAVAALNLAGNGIKAYVDGFRNRASFNLPIDIARAPDGSLYVSDAGSHRIRFVSLGKDTVMSVAGNGAAGYADDTGINASFNTPTGLAFLPNGDLLVADWGNHCIRRVRVNDGNTTLFAGTPGVSGLANGTANQARFNNPAGLVADALGNVYVADAGNHCIRRIGNNGAVTTLAGSTAGFADGTGATAQFNSPQRLVLDAAGNIVVSDNVNNRIRSITTAGVVTTIAGSGQQGFADGSATSAQLNRPLGLAYDALGNLYVADNGNHVVRRIAPGGAVTTYAGQPMLNGFANGLAALALFNRPAGLTIDPSGNLYLADYLNNRVRQVTNR
jgi:sugar lactone lactonase YvrE